jgi:hypothetical protein
MRAGIHRKVETALDPAMEKAARKSAASSKKNVPRNEKYIQQTQLHFRRLFGRDDHFLFADLAQEVFACTQMLVDQT